MGIAAKKIQPVASMYLSPSVPRLIYSLKNAYVRKITQFCELVTDNKITNLKTDSRQMSRRC